MTILALARIYTDLVKLEREIPDEEHQAREKVNALRTQYHELLMKQMRKDRIDFSDRFDAAAKAFELVREADAQYGGK